MGAEQHQPTQGRPTKRDAALARRGLAWTALGVLALSVVVGGSVRAQDSGASSGVTATHARIRTKGPRQPPAGRASPAATKTPPHVPKAPESVRLPTHTRNDTGRVADPRALHGDSKIAAASATEPVDERVISPIHPAGALQPAPFVDVTQPPPFQDPGASPIENSPSQPTADSATTSPARAASGSAEPAESPSPEPPSSARLDRSPPTIAPQAPDETAASAKDPKSSADKPPATSAPSPSAAAPRPATAPAAPAETSASEDSVTTETTVFDQIRLEIKGRLPLFQSCARAARRRGGLEIRRVQATWSVSADGTIRALKVEDVSDPQLAACLTRAGSRPFSTQPGMDLTIPTPIVFVR